MATIAYNEDGTQRSITYGNGVSVALGYDDSVRPSSSVWRTTDGHTLSSTRELSAGGRITSTAYAVDARTSTFQFAYDDARRLANVALAGDLVGAHTWSYTYDSNSNRLTKTTDGVTVNNTYNRADQLVSSTDPTVGTIEYDAAGNATRIGADTFTYGSGSQLRTASDGTRTVEYERAVDGSIRAITTSEGGTSSTVRHASSGVTLDGDGRPVALRAVLPGSALYTVSLTGGQSTWQFNDLAGNKFWTASDAGVQVGTAQIYEPFGSPLTVPDPAVPGVANQAWVALTGNSTVDLRLPYVMMGARVYVPSIGRFLQPDPKVGGSANGYDYGSQDPVNNVDGAGRSWWAELIGVIVVATLSAILLPVAPAVAGAASIAIGAVVGAVSGVVGYAITFGIEQIGGNGPSWDWNQVAWAVGIGALLGGAGAAVKWSKAVTRVDKYNTEGKPLWGKGETVPIEDRIDVKRKTFWGGVKEYKKDAKGLIDEVDDFAKFYAEESGGVFDYSTGGSSLWKVSGVDRGLSNRLSTATVE